MLGLIKPYKMERLVKDCTYYKLYYCSVCRHLVRNHSRPYAFINSYEGTLLAMLYNEMVVQDIGAVKNRCSGLPIVKVASLPADHDTGEVKKKRVKPALYAEAQTGDRIEKDYFSLTYRLNDREFSYWHAPLPFAGGDDLRGGLRGVVPAGTEPPVSRAPARTGGFESPRQ